VYAKLVTFGIQRNQPLELRSGLFVHAF